MKILFIYKFEYVESLGIMYLSSVLKSRGHQVYFLDIAFEKDISSEVMKIAPQVIGYSVTTGKHKFYKELNASLKKTSSFLSVFGGPHCTFFPEFIKEDGVDVVIRGEAEFALLDLIEALEKGKEITKIQNVWVKLDGEIHKNSLRPLVENLDSIPFPDRSLTAKYEHYRKMHRRFVISGRGCPYNCSYCFNHSYNKLYSGLGKVVRKRSVENVIAELKEVRDNFKPRRFQFVDDTFIIDKKWTLEFCAAYKREITIPFMVYLRVNLVTEEIVKALKEAGCVTAVYAIESGDEHIRNKILKRNISEAEILKANSIFKKYKIKEFVQNMIGLPDETLEDAYKTLRLNIKCKPDCTWVSVFQPYPGTDLGQYAVEKGYFNADVNSFNESYFTGSTIKMKDIERLERLQNLFSITVSFPFLLPLVKFLIKLPLQIIYKRIWSAHRIWSYFFKKTGIIDFSEIFIFEKRRGCCQSSLPSSRKIDH
ncbi:MAG TPA: hypothetical protein DCL44_02940 [Elusimicrobia bacterium]|nr:hypothetical protein [Elusimicrobiota bacterium]